MLELNCFAANTTLIVDVQESTLIFEAWPKTELNQEYEVCKKLINDQYTLQIQALINNNLTNFTDY